MWRLKTLTAEIRMLLKLHSLRQIDEGYLRQLSPEEHLALSMKLVEDLKLAHERLGQNSRNSSRPPSSDLPWDDAGDAPGEASSNSGEAAQARTTSAEASPSEAANAASEGAGGEGPGDTGVEQGAPEAPDTAAAPRRPGRQPGAPGHGRTQRIAVSETRAHQCTDCAVCGAEARADEQRAWTAFYSVDVAVGGEAAPGLTVQCIKHVYFEHRCRCGHVTREAPHRAAEDGLWEWVELGEWRLVGPTLCALIIASSYRSRLSRRRVVEFLGDWLGLQLSVGTVQHCLLEAARAHDALEQELVEEVLASGLLHADETTHKERGRTLWLWAFVCSNTVLYYIGDRSKELLDNLLGEGFEGWLMSDGYGAYRHYSRRLRCWAHLVRKARALSDSLSPAAQRFGRDSLAVLDTLMHAVYRAREGPGVDLEPEHRKVLERFRQDCEGLRGSAHEKTRQLAAEFLNDWEAIFRVLHHPHLPLTNNEAERTLRHWVILRRSSYGTRSEVGTRAFALLASVIDTCRLRGASPWAYLAEVIAAARAGQPLPALPRA